MRICTAQLKSTAAYSQSKKVDEDIFPKLPKEGHDDYDKRLWREKSTFVGDTDQVAIPAMGLKMSVDEACKRLGLKIPGRKSSTYAKNFVAGQLCMEDVALGIDKKALQFIDIWANADGVRGSGKRVKRRFPFILQWEGTAQFALLDEIIPKDVFEKCLTEAGRLIGIGRFRPEKGGLNGRFEVVGTSWQVV